MEKQEFIKFLDSIFKSKGFKKKGNNWYCENEILIKKINAQKSKYGNIYYLNYGFIFKGLEQDDLTMHIAYGLSSNDSNENIWIKKLLDLETDIPDEQRKTELKMIIEKNMLCDFENINSENDIVSELEKRPHLNDIPLIVKEYLKLN